MVAVMIALGLLFLLTVFIGDAVGAFVLGFVLLVLGWALWSDREKGEGE
ncbi:MAG TPA: hypothetical protein VKJ47_22910 [Candidatus Binatia bacterium]|nr:hypothetical protein [Candidatus Binatia bacterium]